MTLKMFRVTVVVERYKEPSMLNDNESRVKVKMCNPFATMVTSPYQEGNSREGTKQTD